MSRRAVRTRGGWLSFVLSLTASSLLTTFFLASLCMCSDERVLVQPFVDGCGLAGQPDVQLTAHVEAPDDACLGPCVDVRVLTAGAPDGERQPVPAPGLVAAPAGLDNDAIRLSLLPARSRNDGLTARHLGYTILRC